MLSIFNNYHYDGGLVFVAGGKKVKSVEDGDKIAITLDDGCCISIGMSDEDFNGPETMVLMREGESAVVWN